jgi:hypothetical protein
LYKSPEEVLFRQTNSAKEILMDEAESSADESDEDSVEEIEFD